MVKIEVIKPVIECKDKIILKTIYYPNYVFHLKCTVKRLLLKPISIEGFVTVDPSRVVGLLADSFPQNLEVIDVDEKFIVPARINEVEAENIAKKTFLYFILRLRHLVIPPEIEVVKKKLIYKQYWLVMDKNSKMYVIDSITGDIELIE